MDTQGAVFLKVVSFLSFPSSPPSACSIPLLIILATSMSGFPLSNQIISAVSWTWLACGADRFWPAHSAALLTKPGQMLRCCYFAITSVQRFGGGKADFSSVCSWSQGFFDIFIKNPDDGREMILIMTADHQNLSMNRIPPCKIVSS